MQRVHEAVRGDRAAGRHQGLAGDLAAEDALGADLRALAPEAGRIQLLEVEDLQQLVDGGLALERDRGVRAGRRAVPGPAGRATRHAPRAAQGRTIRVRASRGRAARGRTGRGRAGQIRAGRGRAGGGPAGGGPAGGVRGRGRHTVLGSTSEPSWWTRRVLVEPGAFGGLPATTTT
ncbi:hypothetical protein Asp14428_24580 [Actinoplanes sp. NBRC 14428]|nr:hypothetical protein Asp14428_24580 [Actinoplanes sp. NBRC 14428]